LLQSTSRLIRVLVVDGMSFRQHSLMQDARDQNAAALLPIEQNVLAMLMTTQPRTNVVTESAQRRIVGEHLTTLLQPAEVISGLGLAPFAKGVIGDA
jgi:hypothetical protein